jgi:hypothetical protein
MRARMVKVRWPQFDLHHIVAKSLFRSI